MTKASKFLKRLDQVLSKSCNEFHERDIDAPQVMHEIFDDLAPIMASPCPPARPLPIKMEID